MKTCRKDIACRYCPYATACPSYVRKNKRMRRPMSDTASKELLLRAASLLATGWYTCERLGACLYGDPGRGRIPRMSSMVRARRPINRMKKLGILAVRPNGNGTAEYTLLPDGMEVLESC